jgi:hypothetical protein
MIHSLHQKGFVKRKSDHNLYVKKDENGNVALVSLYVDDIDHHRQYFSC